MMQDKAKRKKKKEKKEKGLIRTRGSPSLPPTLNSTAEFGSVALRAPGEKRVALTLSTTHGPAGLVPRFLRCSPIPVVAPVPWPSGPWDDILLRLHLFCSLASSPFHPPHRARGFPPSLPRCPGCRDLFAALYCTFILSGASWLSAPSLSIYLTIYLSSLIHSFAFSSRSALVHPTSAEQLGIPEAKKKQNSKNHSFRKRKKEKNTTAILFAGPPVSSTVRQKNRHIANVDRRR